MGANYRDPKPVRTYGIEWKITPFSFIPNVTTTTSNPLVADTTGQVVATLTSTGLYKVALRGGAPKMIVDFNISYPVGTKGGFIWELDGDNYNSTAGTFQIRHMTVGTTTLVNFTATTGQVVYGTVWQQASSYTR